MHPSQQESINQHWNRATKDILNLQPHMPRDIVDSLRNALAPPPPPTTDMTLAEETPPREPPSTGKDSPIEQKEEPPKPQKNPPTRIPPGK